MRVLETRNVHQALPKALRLLAMYGEDRQSRNGPVRQVPWPVTTVYAKPLERVLFWPQRDANPAFHLYESLWMLAGRNDLAPLTRYVSDFGKFSDDGETVYGAYGYRWRRSYDDDQLEIIARRLRVDPTDRRSVLQMWQGEYDLDRNSKDLPCNLMCTMQRDAAGALNLSVFCRSNDIIFGAYGANAVHFAFLLEYVAAWIGCPVGIYRQISENWHAYLGPLQQVEGLTPKLKFGEPTHPADPYRDGTAKALPLLSPRHYTEDPDTRMAYLDLHIQAVLLEADHGSFLNYTFEEPFFNVARAVLKAHALWRQLEGPNRYPLALEALQKADQETDWIVAMRQWIERRQARHLVKQTGELAGTETV